MASFAGWTVLYHVALVTGLPADAALAAWAVLTAAVVAIRARWPRRAGVAVTRPATAAASVVALAVASAVALLSAVVVRPDLDDASYLVRTAWVADRGRLPAGDVIFTDDVWPGLAEQSPYLPGFESLLGLIARWSSVAAGDLVYVVYVPVAAFAAVWALWCLVRAWHVRRPAMVLVLATVFLVWGGGAHASWGNLHFARIWQGKVTFLAIVVPLLYAWTARYWAESGARRGASLALLGLAGAAGVGLTPAAIFVVPSVMVVGSMVGVLTGRWRAALVLVAGSSAYPLAAGALAVVAGRTEDAVPGPAENPWVKTLGEGLPFWVAVLAATVVLAGLLVPALAATRTREAQVTAASCVVGGLLVAVPPLYSVAIEVMGTNAIAWRLTWLVPVPVLVGMLAGLPRGRVPGLAGLVPMATALALVHGGVPVPSADNGAHLALPGRWKVPAQARATAEWIVEARPKGLYLAPVDVSSVVGTLTSDLRPVGSRSDYLGQYDAFEPAHARDRAALQSWAEGAASGADVERVPTALDALDVRLACVRSGTPPPAGGGWTEAYRGAAVCWRR